MKERPILFSGPMVCAILEGRKAQTRRIMKPQPELISDANNCFIGEDGKGHSCPYGQQGDQLWVRETHRFYDEGGPLQRIFYKADEDPSLYGYFKWKPSIHMRREYSRITLGITDVRVERLQDISYDDCISEGAGVPMKKLHPDPFHVYQGPFRSLWQSINGSDSWNENPWVWVIEFKRLPS